MIITLILALYLSGLVGAGEAAAFLYVCGLMLITAEFFLPAWGIAGFNGAVALFLGYAIQTGHSQILGFPVGWGLWFGMAFVEALLATAVVIIAVRHRRIKPVSGAEAMPGQKAVVVEWEGDAGRVRVAREFPVAFQRRQIFSPNSEVLVQRADRAGIL